MSHIHTFYRIEPDEFKNAHLREIANLDGLTHGWSADIYDCGESIGDIEAVVTLLPDSTDIRVTVGWEGGDGEEFAETYSLWSAIREFARESIQSVVDEI